LAREAEITLGNLYSAEFLLDRRTDILASGYKAERIRLLAEVMP